MLVEARCLITAWDGIACDLYVPGKGPLEGGLFQIDSDWEHLNKMVTPTGDYVFQYPGHAGKAPKEGAKPVVAVKPPEPVALPHSDTVIQERVSGSRGRPLSEAHKAKLAAGRAARKARLAAAA
jgi:hypothetical protein